MRTRSLALLAALAALTAACVRKRHAIVPPAPPVSAVEVGLASWYGPPYHGRPAANGEIYDMDKLTAAHRTLPFGALVRVENLDNRKSVDVRIIDRGPFVEGRVIDLSRAAARAIELIGPGTAKVRLRVVELPARATEPEYYAVQVGAFQDRSRAERLQKSIGKKFGVARLSLRRSEPPLWRVQVGSEPTLEQAELLAARMKAAGMRAFVVRVDEGL